MSTRIKALLILTACTVLLAPATAAATRTVPSALYPTIQAAEDAAFPGDVISIQPGVYYEDVEVDTPDLRFIGSCANPRAVVVDGSDSLSYGFEVDAADTEIKCLTIRHYNSAGIDVDADDLTVYKVNTIFTCTGIDGTSDGFDVQYSSFFSHYCEGVDLVGDNGVYRYNEMHLCDGAEFDGNNLVIQHNTSTENEDDYCIEVDGNNALIEDNFCDGADDPCLAVDGDDATIRRNTLKRCEGYGIDVDGERNLVEDNTIEQTEDAGIYGCGDFGRYIGNTVDSTEDYDCFELDGDNLVVSGNTATKCGEAGFTIDGDSLLVTGNVADGTLEESFCIDSSTGASTINDNVGRRNGDDEYGFDVDLDDGSSMRRNLAENIYDTAFYIDFDFGTFEYNECYRSGADQEGCFELDLDDSLIKGNRAEWNAGTGMEVDGDDNEVISNVLKNNAIDGLHNDGDRNLLKWNVTMLNDGEGIQNDGDDTDLIRNTSRSNRIDCADGGGSINTNTTYCGDGSNFTVPDEID